MLTVLEKESDHMDLRTELNDEMKKAMRDKKQVTLSTIRLIMAAVKERDIQCRTQGASEAASDQDILSLLQSMIKQRVEASKTYYDGGRDDLAKREEEEIEVIKSFLPSQLDNDELEKAVAGIIDKTGAADIKDMGKVMGELKKQYAGQVDMGKASSIVKDKLSA